ncbi:hypothetical protein ACLOJK_025865 [Asimina triloba]
MDPPSAACWWGRSVPLWRTLPAVVLVIQTPACPDLVLHGRRHPRSALPPPWKKPGARRTTPPAHRRSWKNAAAQIWPPIATTRRCPAVDEGEGDGFLGQPWLPLCLDAPLCRSSWLSTEPETKETWPPAADGAPILLITPMTASSPMTTADPAAARVVRLPPPQRRCRPCRPPALLPLSSIKSAMSVDVGSSVAHR